MTQIILSVYNLCLRWHEKNFSSACTRSSIICILILLGLNDWNSAISYSGNFNTLLVLCVWASYMHIYYLESWGKICQFWTLLQLSIHIRKWSFANICDLILWNPHHNYLAVQHCKKGIKIKLFKFIVFFSVFIKFNDAYNIF